jgi:ABC-2 type transport system permease protein
MLNPLANVAIYGFVFGVLFGITAPPGENSGLSSFALFLLCALLPWNFFALTVNLGMTSISANSGLVRRVAFPREVLVFSNVAHALVQFSIELLLLVVILLTAGSPLLPYLPIALLLTALLTVFGAGYALALSTLSVYFRDLSYLWAIVMQVWFFLTPVVYGPEVIQENVPEWGQNLIRLNPMVHFVAAFRDSLYHATSPGFGKMSVLAGCSAGSLALGWVAFTRLGRRLPEEV